MARGDGTSVVGYDPENRIDAQNSVYYAPTTSDRWFIPYNDGASTADQVTRCDVMVGDTDDGSVAATVAAGSTPGVSVGIDITPPVDGTYAQHHLTSQLL